MDDLTRQCEIDNLRYWRSHGGYTVPCDCKQCRIVRQIEIDLGVGVDFGKLIAARSEADEIQTEGGIMDDILGAEI